MTEKTLVSIKDIRMRFGSNEVLKGINLDIPNGEFLTLLGPSGCGKTTLLRIVAGFLAPHSGSILINGKDVTKLAAYERGLGMVFQNYALWPHKNVEEHLSFGLKLAKIKPNEITERTKWALDLVGLSGFEKRVPAELSGGQQQRVALARAISLHPTILLLDEPLSNLDRKLRDEMRVELRLLQQKLGITTIYVTHDQTEALTMSDRIVVMCNGEIEQIADPRNLYERPANVFVAKFLGTNNMVSVKVHSLGNGKAAINLDGQELVVPVTNLSFNEKEAYLLLRPENVVFANFENDGKTKLTGTVTIAVFEGKEMRYTIALDNSQITLGIASSGAKEYAVGDKVELRIIKGALVSKEGRERNE
ncbi:ABC transporter ATP-binding protein [Candidatus Formimonas warabiya]|nr:ABC transporter ATP-binding protein [Candidatus Formimonas warabiya]